MRGDGSSRKSFHRQRSPVSNAVYGGQKTVYVDLLKPDPAADSSRPKRLPDSVNDEVADQSGANVDVFLKMPDFADDGELGNNLREEIFFFTFSLFLHCLFVISVILSMLPGDVVWLNTSFLSCGNMPPSSFDASHLNDGCHGEFAMRMSCRHDSFS